MRSHAKNSRRSRGHKGPDEDYYTGAHGDEMRPETYPHVQEMSHRSEGYRPSSASARSSYDTNREVSNSRNQRSEAWHRNDLDDTYITNDDYHHLSRGRGDHEILAPRESEWSGRAQAEYRYPSSRGDWHDHTYPSSSYAESSRSTPNALPRQSRAPPSYDPWVAEEPPPEHRRGLDAVDDRSMDRVSYDWSRDHHRDKKGQKFQSDSGWDTHRRQRGWEAPIARRDSSPNKDNVDLTDRSWEPAPSWRPSGPSDNNSQGYRNGQRTSNTDRSSSSTMSKSGKRVPHNNKVKRDWRTDDGTLNKYDPVLHWNGLSLISTSVGPGERHMIPQAEWSARQTGH